MLDSGRCHRRPTKQAKQRFRVRVGQRFQKVPASPYRPNGPITQLSPSLTRNRCTVSCAPSPPTLCLSPTLLVPVSISTFSGTAPPSFRRLLRPPRFHYSGSRRHAHLTIKNEIDVPLQTSCCSVRYRVGQRLYSRGGMIIWLFLNHAHIWHKQQILTYFYHMHFPIRISPFGLMDGRQAFQSPKFITAAHPATAAD